MSTELILASDTLSSRLGVEKLHMLATIKAQCFKGKSPDQVSDTQLAAFVQIAVALDLNPLLPGFLYAYPERNGGIQPIIGPDGAFKLLSSRPDVVSWECDVFPADPAERPTHAVAQIWVKGTDRPRKFTAYFDEWFVDSNPNWKTRPRHMLWVRALKQCSRQVIHGIPFDEDERVITERNGGEPLNVTHSAADLVPAASDKAPERPVTPPRRGGARAASSETPAPAAPTETHSPASGEPSAPTKTAATTTGTPVTVVQPPEIAPGVDLVGFHGKAWPQVLRLTIKEITKLAVTPAGTPIAMLTATTDDHSGDLTFVTFEHVMLANKKCSLVAEAGQLPLLTVGRVIEANVRAKQRPGVDPQDKTKQILRTDIAPVLWLEQVSEAVGSTVDV